MMQQPVPEKAKQRHGRGVGTGEGGAALVVTMLFLVALLGFGALSIDVGNCHVQKNYIQEAGDAAALGAVQDWAFKISPVSMGTTIAGKNGVLANEVISVIGGVWNASSKTFTPNISTFANNAVPAVRVTTQRVVPTAFLVVFGYPTITVTAQSTAIAAQATSATGLLPLGAQTASYPNPQPCDTIDFKYGSGGNTGIAAMPDGRGASWLAQNLQFGYSGTVSIGDVIETEPGNKVGPTDKSLSDRIGGAATVPCPYTGALSDNPRIAIIMGTSDNVGQGRSSFTVTAFWVVALDDPSGGHVTGKFLELYAGGVTINPTNATAGGLGGVGLVQ